MAPDDRLNSDEVALVLRRAAELEAASFPLPHDEGLSVEAVEAAAAEVGLPVLAVRQAVAELRAGALSEAPPDTSGKVVLVEARVVPYDVGESLAMIGTWLESQAFHRHRFREGSETWRPRDDVLAKVQRSINWMATIRVKDVREVTVRAVAVADGTLVRIEAVPDGSITASPGIGAGLGGMAGGGVGMIGGALTAGGPPVVVAAGATVAGLGAVGGWRAGLAYRRARAARIADELSAHLDRVGHGEVEQGPLDRLRTRLHRIDPARAVQLGRAGPRRDRHPR